MKPLSKIAEAVQASTTMAIDAMYKKMKAEGIDVVGFGAGEPDFDTPDNVKEAGIKAIKSNFTRYTPPSGIEKLREAAAARLESDCGVFYKPSQVVVASGAKHNIFIALMTLCNPGDEVILPAPFWVSYYELIKMAGAVPVIVYTNENTGFKITAEQLKAAITPKTKAIIINSPSNPTGMTYSRDELLSLCNVCVSNDIYIISDEVYYKLLYDGMKFTSVSSLGPEIYDRTILINGVSKSYAMTGWRIGFAAATEKIAKAMSNYLSHSTSAPSSISQMAALEALTGPQDGIDKMREAFEERRNYIVEHINKIEGVSCIKPEGAFYVMMSIEKLVGTTLHGVRINNSDDFAAAFLKNGLVALVPCTGFGAPNYLRWSYAVSMQDIKEGLSRLEKFLKG